MFDNDDTWVVMNRVFSALKAKGNETLGNVAWHEKGGDAETVEKNLKQLEELLRTFRAAWDNR